MKKSLQYLLAGVCLVMLPSMALAQSTIAGVVKDASGAVVAGATVEAASDVLIEKSRTVTTNGEGRYTIVDLRPGSYVVISSAPGFSTIKQTVQVPADVTVTVDAALKVGSVGETVSVEARVATVDIENTAHPETLSRTEMDALPTARYMQAMAVAVPGAHLNLPDVGGSQQIEQNYISVHGNGSVHDTYMLDGLLINTTYSDGQIQQYVDNGAIQETTFQTSNVNALSSGGGMYTNMVPREGGNDFHADFFGGGSGGDTFWQGNNLPTSFASRGLSAQNKTVKIQDINGAFGGPVFKDKLWFMLTGRDQTTFSQSGGSFYPNGAPGVQMGTIYAGTFRLTYQMNAKNKFSAFILRNWKYKNPEILDNTANGVPFDPSTAATQRTRWPMYYILQTKWTGTPTSKLVTEVGMSISHLDYNDLYQAGIQQVSFSPAWYAQTTQSDAVLTKRYLAGGVQRYYQSTRNYFGGAATYVTGSHQVKVGVQYSFGPYHISANMNGDGVAVFNNGLPSTFTAYDTPYYQRPKLNDDTGVYATDTWHFKRVTVNAGLRMEHMSGEIEAENAPAGRFVPARSIPTINCNNKPGMGCWLNWTPRLGIVYDVFGNHKTAIKAGFGKYNTQYSTSFMGNFNPMTEQSQTGITWNTAGLTAAGGICATVPVTVNGTVYITPNPKCYTSAGFSPAGTTAANIPLNGLGASTNPSFGTATNIPALDPNFHREYNLQYTVGLQQELFRRLTLNVNWYRRSDYQNVLVQNYAFSNALFTQSSIINPLDGTTIPIFNQIKSAGANSLYQSNTPQSLVRNVYLGTEVSLTARLGHGQFWNFGWTRDRDLDRSCAENTSIASSRNDPNTLRFCDMFGDSGLSFQGINVASLGAVPSVPWHNEFKLHGSIPIKWGFVGSLNFSSLRLQGSNPAGPSSVTTTNVPLNDGFLLLTWAITPSTRYPTDCSQCPNDPANSGLKALVDPGIGSGFGQSSITVQLVAPGQVLSDRLNQVDIGFRRVFKFREKYRLEPEVQFFNLFNSSAVISQGVVVPTNGSSVNNYKAGGLGGNVTTYEPPRIMRIALQFHF